MLLINEWIFETFSYRFDGSSKMSLFYFSFFDFDDFLTIFAKNFMKRSSVFMIDIKSLYKLLLFHKYLRSRNFWQWNDDPLNIFKIFYWNAFSLFVFIKWKNHFNVPFNNTYKMYCFHLFQRKLKLFETTFSNIRPSNMVSHFIRFFTFSCLYSIFAENFMKKLSFFDIDFWNSFLYLLFCQVLRSQTCHY